MFFESEVGARWSWWFMVRWREVTAFTPPPFFPTEKPFPKFLASGSGYRFSSTALRTWSRRSWRPYKVYSAPAMPQVERSSGWWVISVEDERLEPTAITHLERKMIFQTSMIMFHVNLQGCRNYSIYWLYPLGLLVTNISHQKSLLEIICLFPRWDILVPWRSYCRLYTHGFFRSKTSNSRALIHFADSIVHWKRRSPVYTYIPTSYLNILIMCMDIYCTLLFAFTCAYMHVHRLSHIPRLWPKCYTTFCMLWHER